MHHKTVTILLRIRVREHFVMSITKYHESPYVGVLDNPQTQWRYLPTSILTNANKEGGKGEGQTTTQKQGLELKTTLQLPRVSTHHLKLGENPYVK